MRTIGESRIVLVSKKFLKSGTEITYNYQYFEDGLDGGTEMKRQKCLCGTLHCSGNVIWRNCVPFFSSVCLPSLVFSSVFFMSYYQPSSFTVPSLPLMSIIFQQGHDASSIA